MKFNFNSFLKPEYLVAGALLFGTGFFVAKYLMNKKSGGMGHHMGGAHHHMGGGMGGHHHMYGSGNGMGMGMGHHMHGMGHHMHNKRGGQQPPLNATTPYGERDYSHAETPLNYAMMDKMSLANANYTDSDYDDDSDSDTDLDNYY